MDVKFHCLQVLINDDYVTLNQLQPLIDLKYEQTEETHFRSMECLTIEPQFIRLYFQSGDPRPWNPKLVDIRTRATVDNSRKKDQFEPKLHYGLLDLERSQVWLPHVVKSIFKEAILSQHKNASFKEILDEDEFFNTIQSLNQMKFGIAPDQLLNSISDLSQALTNDANGYGANYAELVMTFNKNESITDRVKSLFKKAINQKSSFKKIGNTP